MSTFLQQIVFGCLVGGLYGLAAAGLSLVFGVLKILNVAHGELIMLGGYGAYWFFSLLGFDPFASIRESLKCSANDAHSFVAISGCWSTSADCKYCSL